MQKISLRRWAGITGLALSLILSACGGGGGSGGTTSSTPAKLVGTAATGAPMGGATITVFDKTGATVGTTTVADDGTYSVNIAATAQPPFVMVATRDDQVLYSTYADGLGSTINITPLTTLLAARLSPTGDPSALSSQISGGSVTVSLSSVQAAVTELTNALSPIITAAAGSTTTNILTGGFTADGTGLDRVLDVLKVDTQNINGAVTMVVTVNTTSTTDSTTTATVTPAALTFSASTTSLTTTTATVSSSTLLPSGGSSLVADLLARMNTCYALPTTTRVSGGSVLSSSCTSLFVNNDPTQYKHNSNTVGSSGAFSNLFVDSGTNTLSDRGNFEYFRGNGDWVFTYRQTDALGNVNNTVGVARLNSTDNKLYLIGNQYAYKASVKPIAQIRDFVNQPALSYYSTGYNISIANASRFNGTSNVPKFSQVVVTTPKGNTLTFKPKNGDLSLSFLGLVNPKNSSQVISTSLIRLASKFIGSTSGYVHPSDLATVTTTFNTTPEDLPYANFGTGHQGQLTDAEIAAIPDQGVWKLEFYHSDGVTPNVIQTYKTFSRARTMSEISQSVFVDLTSDGRSLVRASTAANKGVAFGTVTQAISAYTDKCDANIMCLSTNNGGDLWTVPTGAVAPTGVDAYGSYNGFQSSYFKWDDPVNFPSSARTAVIKCGGPDPHCDATQQDQYANGTTVRAFQLFGTNIRQVEFTRIFLFWTLP